MNSNDNRRQRGGLPQGGARPVSSTSRTRSSRSRPRSTRVQAFPTTAFYDSKGKLAFVHQGAYPDRERPGQGHRPLRSLILDVRAAQHASRGGAPRSTLRERVFCGEQGVSLEADRTGATARRPTSSPSTTARVVGTCRLLFRGRWRGSGGWPSTRDAPRRGHRGGAPGARPTGVALDAGAERDLAARADVRASLYLERRLRGARAGRFVEEGIEHVAMEKRLA